MSFQLNNVVIRQYAARKKKLRANGYASYDEYLRSDEWRRIKAKAKSRPEIYGHCYVCGATDNIQLHHYRYGKIGKGMLAGLRPLCVACHGQVHAMTTGDSKCSLKKATNVLRKKWLAAIYQ